MKQFFRFSGTLAGVMALALIPAISAQAQGTEITPDPYEKTKTPAYFSPKSDRALLYVARPYYAHLIGLEDFKVFVDDKPAGWLPQRSYLAMQIEPGRRLLWGPSQNESQRFNFEAGKTYLLVLEEIYVLMGNRSQLDTSRWLPSEPEELKGLISARKLEYVTTREEEMADLGKEAAKKYAKVNAKTHDVAEPSSLPFSFGNVWYRTEKKKLLFKGYEATGILSISPDSIDYKSDKKTLSIPIKNVLRITQGTFATIGDQSPWDIVVFTTDAGEEVAAFRDGRSLGAGAGTGLIFRMLVAAAQQKAKPTPGEPQSSAAANAGQPSGSSSSSPVTPQGKTLGSPLLQQDTLNTISLMDEATASECKANRRIVKMEVTSPPTGVKMKNGVMVAGSWGERWIIDRCGAQVAYDITYTADSRRGGTNFSFGPAQVLEHAETKNAPAPPLP